MLKSKETQHSRHYSKIGLKRRQNLINLVLQKNYSIGRAAYRFKIKLSTAKMIVKKYRQQGNFFEEKAGSPYKQSQDNNQQKKVELKQQFAQDKPQYFTTEGNKDEQLLFDSSLLIENQNKKIQLSWMKLSLIPQVFIPSGYLYLSQTFYF